MNLKDKKSVTQDQKNKGTKPLVDRSVNFHNKPDSDKRPSVRCWNCNEKHYPRDYPHKKGDNIHNIMEETVGDVGKTRRIYACLEGVQAYHQYCMIEVAGKVGNRTMSILFDS